MNWTQTLRGRALDLLHPQPDDVDLKEICVALSQQCRYAGGVKIFYSIAEHSVHICRALLRDGHDVRTQLAGLLHDAAEAYTGDLTWPMQNVLFASEGPDDAGAVVRRRYKQIQRGLDEHICAKVGLDPSLLHTDPVKTYDLQILLDERRSLLSEPPPKPWPVESELGLTPLEVQICGWTPKEARRQWNWELGRLT